MTEKIVQIIIFIFSNLKRLFRYKRYNAEDRKEFIRY